MIEELSQLESVKDVTLKHNKQVRAPSQRYYLEFQVLLRNVVGYFGSHQLNYRPIMEYGVCYNLTTQA